MTDLGAARIAGLRASLSILAVGSLIAFVLHADDPDRTGGHVLEGRPAHAG